MNKKGGMVLRDIMFLVLIFSGIIALSSVLVSEMGTTYDNTNMSNEFNQDTIGDTQLNETANTWEDIGQNLEGNLFQFLAGT